MRTLYRIDSSIQGDQSVTREITNELERVWSTTLPDGAITRRDLLSTPLPSRVDQRPRRS